MITLPPGTVHVHYLRCDDVHDSELLRAYHGWMSPEEVAQHARFAFPEGKHQYLMTRALARGVLSRYAPVAPAAWSFESNAYGRPEITPGVAPGLRFNLSNTPGLIACAVTTGCDVGVDVESIERRGSAVELADQYFAPSEVRALRDWPADQQRSRFFDYWTLKEAYIKARGLGLAIPLDQFAFELTDAVAPRIVFASGFDDEAGGWQFWIDRSLAPFTIAIAVRSVTPLAVSRFETVPVPN